MSGEVVFLNRQRKVKVTKQLKELISKAVAAALEHEGFSRPYEVVVMFVSDKAIRLINKDTRGVDKPTDVLSFPMGENGEYEIDAQTGRAVLGDMAVSLERALAQSEEFGHSFEREAAYLAVHSVLHLLGYDHMQEDEKSVMRSREKQIMKKLMLYKAPQSGQN